eukprot:7826337-Pyramimonas_sp.AAC.1
MNLDGLELFAAGRIFSFRHFFNAVLLSWATVPRRHRSSELAALRSERSEEIEIHWVRVRCITVGQLLNVLIQLVHRPVDFPIVLIVGIVPSFEARGEFLSAAELGSDAIAAARASTRRRVAGPAGALAPPA